MANTMAAVEMGVRQVQGTINGFGERCGNLNLCSLIPNLQLKLGKNCIEPEQLKKLRDLSHVFYELTCVRLARGGGNETQIGGGGSTV